MLKTGIYFTYHQNQLVQRQKNKGSNFRRSAEDYGLKLNHRKIDKQDMIKSLYKRKLTNSKLNHSLSCK